MMRKLLRHNALCPVTIGLTGKAWGLSKKLSDLGKESNKAKILLQ